MSLYSDFEEIVIDLEPGNSPAKHYHGTMPPSLLIYAPETSPRLTYISRVLFEVLYPIPYRLCTSVSEYQSFEGLKINYSVDALEGNEVHILPSGLLAASTITSFTPGVCWPGGHWPALFPDTEGVQTAFSHDLFSSCFFLLSRYEEYQGERQYDIHGRLLARDSWQREAGLLEYPLVDYWAMQLVAALQQRWPGADMPKRRYRHLPTFDIDIAWAYLQRPWWRQALSLARDIAAKDWANLRLRFQVWAGKETDPYDCYAWLRSALEVRALEARFFFHLGDYGPGDPALSYRNQALRSLVREVDSWAQVGLHPSLASNRIKGRLDIEKNRIEAILGRAVRETRQHYLALSLPDTYRQLLGAGFEKDYSMGFSDRPGFRAGISGPFPWYDLQAERPTDLWIQPLHVMDVTLKQYLRLDPEEAKLLISRLAGRCREVNGVFCSLWHNSSFHPGEGWAGWKPVFLHLLDE